MTTFSPKTGGKTPCFWYVKRSGHQNFTQKGKKRQLRSESDSNRTQETETYFWIFIFILAKCGNAKMKNTFRSLQKSERRKRNRINHFWIIPACVAIDVPFWYIYILHYRIGEEDFILCFSIKLKSVADTGKINQKPLLRPTNFLLDYDTMGLESKKPKICGPQCCTYRKC